MRSGRWAAITGAVLATGLLTGACGQAHGVAGMAGVSAMPGASTPAPTPTPVVTGTIPAKKDERPEGGKPVKVPPPKLSKYTYVFPVKGCAATYARKLLVLPKTTIWAAKGCSFVAPVAGVVDETNGQNKWRPSTDRGPDREGRFVSIIGDDGVRYLGGHLDGIADGIKPGIRVRAGQYLGTVGKSGNARNTGANLYFAISWKAGPGLWWVRRGMVEPWSYLDAWLSGNKTLSPREATSALRGRLGEAPRCQVQCKGKKAPQSNKDAEDKPEEDDTGVIVVDPTVNPTATRP